MMMLRRALAPGKGGRLPSAPAPAPRAPRPPPLPRHGRPLGRLCPGRRRSLAAAAARGGPPGGGGGGQGACCRPSRREGCGGAASSPPPRAAAAAARSFASAAPARSLAASACGAPQSPAAGSSSPPPSPPPSNTPPSSPPATPPPPAGPRGVPSRSEQLSRLRDPGQVFDVAVVGGGATGCGIALDAASRGLSVALVERGDFASETSSRSTKLVWAGIRYLGTAAAALLSRRLLTDPLATLREFRSELSMVLHCHRERHYMATKQAHLVEWVPIAVPFRTWKMDPPPFGHPLFAYFPLFAPLAFKVYDMLSYFQCPPSYVMTPRTARRDFPQLFSVGGGGGGEQEPSGGGGSSSPPPPPLKYCAVFYEALHNDARTNLAIALTAAGRGAVVANYVEAVGIVKEGEGGGGGGRAAGVVVRDAASPSSSAGETWSVRAKKVVLAAGPFTDDLRRLDAASAEPVVQGSAGTHVVVPGHFLPKSGLGMLDPMTSDGRFLFVLPWQGHALIGTTDRKGPAVSLPAPPEADVEWLLNECRTHLGMRARRDQVLSSWCGWRPLAKDPNVAAEDGPVSRDHVISEDPDTGVVFVAGGKWTTWRHMAEELVDRVVGPTGPPSQTLRIRLHGGDGCGPSLPYELLQAFPAMTEDVARHLARTYGGRAWEVCELCEPSSGTPLWPQFGVPLVRGFPYVDGEVRYAVREYATTIEDVLSRRTRLAFLNKKAAVSAIPAVADLMADELGWTVGEKRRQMLSARLYLESYGGPAPQAADVLLREASRESPQRLFATLDRDGSGYIDHEEVIEAVGILGLDLTEGQVEGAFRRMDAKGHGRVSAEEFAVWWEKFRASRAFEQMMADLDHKRSGGTGAEAGSDSGSGSAASAAERPA